MLVMSPAAILPPVWFAPDQVPRALQIPLALAVWGLNLAFSVWWLARFRFGPAEWLWRTLTYGQAQPMRR